VYLKELQFYDYFLTHLVCLLSMSKFLHTKKPLSGIIFCDINFKFGTQLG